MPFGPRADSQKAVEAVRSDEPPPSAEDFWGERSAAIHDALQAPADDPAPVGAAGTRRPRRSLRTLDRRILATAAGTLAVAAIVLLAVSSSFSGPSRPVVGSKAGVAAVFGSGISRLMQLGLAKLDISAARNLAPRADSRETRHTPHRRSATRTIHRRQRPITGRPRNSVRPRRFPSTRHTPRPTTTRPAMSTPSQVIDRFRPPRRAGRPRLPRPSARPENPARSAPSNLRTAKEHR